MLIIGADYSMTCPAITMYCGEANQFDFHKCKVRYRSERRPIEWLNIIGTYMDGKLVTCNERRWDELSNWAMNNIVDFSIANSNEAITVYIEDYSFGSAGRGFHIAEAAGLFKHKLWGLGADIVPVSPSVVKKFYSGKGNALKNDMYTAFVKETDINLMAVFQPKAENVGSPVGDIVDSYALCRYGVLVGGRGNLEPKKKKISKSRKVNHG